MKIYQKYTSFVFLSLFLLLGALGSALYSNWGQSKIRSWILSALAKEGIEAEVHSLSGFFLPNNVVLKKIRIDLPQDGSLSIESASASVSLLYFLKNELCLKKADLSGIVWKSPKAFQTSSSPSLPMAFFVKSLKASNVLIDDLEPVEITGQLKVEARQKGLFLNLEVFHGEDQIYFKLKQKKSGFARFEARIKTVDSSWLQSVYKAPLQGELALQAKGVNVPKKGIRGRFKGSLKMQKGPEALQIPLDFNGRLQRTLEGNWSFSSIRLQGKNINASGSLSFDSKGHFLEASGQLALKQLFIPSLQGELFARWMLRQEEGNILGKTVAQIPLLQAGDFAWEGVELITESVNKQGSFTLKGKEWQGGGEFVWRDPFQLNKLYLKAPQVNGEGAWEFSYNGTMKGTSELKIDNLQILKPLFPTLDLYGQLNLKTAWEGKRVSLDMIAKDLYLKSFYFEQAALYSDLYDPLHELSGIVSIDVEKGSYRDLRLDSALMETVLGGAQWPFKLFAEGIWNRDFEMHSEGFWHRQGSEMTAVIRDLHGLFYSHPFSLKESVELFFSPEKTEIPSTQIEVDGAFVKGEWHKEQNASSFSLRLDAFPIDCLSINPLEVSITGKLDLEAEGSETDQKAQGHFQAVVTGVEIVRFGEEDIITANGNFSGRFEGDQLFLLGDLSTRGRPLASWDFKVPAHLHFTSLSLDLLEAGPTEGKFHLEGQIEDFLDFFNLKSHWLQGRCVSHFSWSDSLKNPLVEGVFQLNDGYYENYLTGVQLTDLKIEAIAEKGLFYLKSLTAKDAEQTGSLFADGEVQLNVKKKFPFHIHAAFQNFHFVELGVISAKADSAIDIEGTWEKSMAKGEVHIIESDLKISEKLTKKPPNLEVVYLNVEKPLPVPPASENFSYPLFLDLIVDTPEPLQISGRGLQSQWKGNFLLKGTHSAPQPIGSLELLKGEFSFSGRLFKLTKGQLAFSVQDSLIPRIDLSGTTEQQGISIIVSLQGPLNQPQITFQSVPQLPLSSIIAYLLFGQDISEINGLQALQLATAVTNIAGQSPDILESTRKSLGIDRLRIVSQPGSEGGEAISIQVGKYVAEGVLVSISQSTENSAPDISIEVDIGKGFFFQAETDQLQEQGKFGIKWNRNY